MGVLDEPPVLSTASRCLGTSAHGASAWAIGVRAQPRQLLHEHRAPGLRLLTVSGVRTMAEVLPDAFGPEDL